MKVYLLKRVPLLLQQQFAFKILGIVVVIDNDSLVC
jgi:hypothetical protein